MACNCNPYVQTAGGPATVETGGEFPLGSVVHYRCRDCDLKGNGILCAGGFFEVTGSVVMSPVDGSQVQPMAVSLRQDGDKVQGGSGAFSSMATVTVPLHCYIANDGQATSTLTLTNDGPAVTVEATNLSVRKVG